MKKIIVLKGKSNVGKSSTIRMVYERLMIKYPNCKVEYLAIANVDIRAVLTINGIKIGIESQGDPCSRLFDSLKMFVNINCQVIICATRSRGATVTAATQLESAYNILWIEKNRMPDAAQANDNLEKSEQIKRQLELIICGAEAA